MRSGKPGSTHLLVIKILQEDDLKCSHHALKLDCSLNYRILFCKTNCHVSLTHTQMVPTTWRWTLSRASEQGKCSPSTPESWCTSNARPIPTPPTATSGSPRAPMPQRSSQRDPSCRWSPTSWPRQRTTCAEPSTTWPRSRMRPSSLWWWPAWEQVGGGRNMAGRSRAWVGFGNPLR